MIIIIMITTGNDYGTEEAYDPNAAVPAMDPYAGMDAEQRAVAEAEFRAELAKVSIIISWGLLLYVEHHQYVLNYHHHRPEV